MTTFQLSNDLETFTLNLKGEVLDDTQQAIGRWTTNENNQIIIRLLATEQQLIDVVWQFDKNNHLCLFSKDAFLETGGENMDETAAFLMEDSETVDEEATGDSLEDIEASTGLNGAEEEAGEEEVLVDELTDDTSIDINTDEIEPIDGTEDIIERTTDGETSFTASATTLNEQKVILNFNTTPNARVRYQCDKARLMITPDARNRDFSFPLFGEWGLDDNHLMTWTANGVTSVLDGVLQDNRSRFVYRFRDKQDLRRRSRLIFTGSWEQEMRNRSDGSGFPSLKFHYHCHDDTIRTFSLPGALVVDKSLNQFAYTYDKDSESVGITLMGFFEVSETFEITYTIDKQVSRQGDEEISTTKFGLIGAVSNDTVEGELELEILKDNNEPSNYKLTLAGEYFCEHDDSSLMIGFRFQQQRENGVVTTAVGLRGHLFFDNGEVFYILDMNPFEQTLRLETGIHVRVENGVNVDQKLLVEGTDGQVRKVSFLLGISF